MFFALFIVPHRIDNITRNGQHHHNKDHLGHCAAQQAADGPQCLTEPGKREILGGDQLHGADLLAHQHNVHLTHRVTRRNGCLHEFGQLGFIDDAIQ